VRLMEKGARIRERAPKTRSLEGTSSRDELLFNRVRLGLSPTIFNTNG